MKLVAIALLILGVVSLVWGGIPYTSKRTVVELGDFKATASEQRTFPIPRPAGGVLVAAGAFLLFRGLKRS
ncbi:MAG: hypothetical protein ACM3JJ_00035 [Hyphomicrobiales bacterium]